MREGIESFTVDTRTITVSLIDPSIWGDYIKAHIRKNFPNALFMTYSIVIFPREGETLKYRILLSTLAGLYAKSHQEVNYKALQDSISDYEKTPLRIQLVRPNAITNLMNIQVFRLSYNRLAFRASVKSSLFFNYFRTFFKSSLVRINNEKSYVILDFNELSSLLKLENILKRKTFIGTFIASFIYNDNDIKKFIHDLRVQFEQPEEKHTQHFTKVSPISTHLAVLNAHEKEAFDDIKKRYIKLVKEYHPDRVYNAGEEKVALYTQKFQQNQEAFTAIKEHYKIAS